MSTAIPVVSTYVQHFSQRATQRPPCCKNSKSNPLRFCKTTSESDQSEFTNSLIDLSIFLRSSSTAALEALNPCCLCIRAAVPVPILASPMVNNAATVRAVKGSRFLQMMFRNMALGVHVFPGMIDNPGDYYYLYAKFMAFIKGCYRDTGGHA